MAFKKTATFLIKFTISIGLLAWLFQSVEIDALMVHLNGVTVITLIVISFLIVTSVLLIGYRWTLLLAYLKHPRLTVVQATKNVIIGLFFNQFLPSTVGGDVVRIWLAKRHGLPMDIAAYSVISDRLFGFTGLVLVCAAGLPLMMSYANDSIMITGVMTLVLGGLGVLAFIVFFQYLPDWLKHLKALRWMTAISNVVGGVIVKSGRGLEVLIISLCLHLIDVTLLFGAAMMLGIDIPYLVCLALIPPAILVSAIPISIAGWGVREGAMVFALGAGGIASADVIVLSLFYGFAQALAGAIGGIVWVRSSYARAGLDQDQDIMEKELERVLEQGR